MLANLKTKSKHAQAAANIKRDLASAFPGIKFQVRSNSYSGGCSVTAYWELGPTSREVDAIINNYQEGSFDGMTDCYNYDRDPDAEAFRARNGSAKYVFSSRSLPDGLFERICGDIASLQGVPFTSTRQRQENDSLDLSDYAHRALARTSFPAGAEYLGVAYGFELQLTGACGANNLYRIIHSKTDEEAELREVVKREFDWIKQQEDQRAIESFEGLYLVQ